MSTTVFEQEKSVFFAMDEVDATDEAGGCTQEWWDAEVAATSSAAAMAKLVDGTGTPLIEMTECDYTRSNDRITKANIAVGVEVGMVAYVIEREDPDDSIDTGRYVITDRDPVGDDWIECEGINGDDDEIEVDVVIGGAFGTLQDALDETDASSHSVLIFTQSVAVLAAQIDIDAGGNNTKNTFKRIVGFNAAPGDMDYGGSYYESPVEILQNGSIDAGKTVLLDADDGAFELLNIDADNIIIENFHLSNNDENKAAVLFSNTPKNIAFRNCRFSAVKWAINSAADSVLVDSCYAHSDITWIHYVLRGNNNVILNCVSSDIPAGADFAVVVAVYGAQVIGCIAINGAHGVRVSATNVVAMNNTFYNQTDYGITVENAETGIVFNNIFATVSAL